MISTFHKVEVLKPSSVQPNSTKIAFGKGIYNLDQGNQVNLGLRLGVLLALGQPKHAQADLEKLNFGFDLLEFGLVWALF